MKRLALPLLALALPLSACDSTEDELVTITATVVDDTQLSTLEAAVIEAGLDDDLAGAGPFTVFAPTDIAFGSLLEDLDVSAAELLARDDLGDILELHVVAGTFDSDDLDVGDTVTTLNGQTLTVVATTGGAGIGLDTEDEDDEANATIETVDIDASNGIVHKIGYVLIPEGE